MVVASKQPHCHIVLLIPRKRIILGPAFLLQVGNDVLAGDFPGDFAKQGCRFPDAGFMVPDPAVPHSIFRGPVECVEPSVDFLERLSKPHDGLVAVGFER